MVLTQLDVIILLTVLKTGVLCSTTMEIKDITKPAVTINENATFESAMKAMVNSQTNTLLVINDEGVLVGEVSVADLMDAIVPEYLDGDSIAANFATEEMFSEAVIDSKDDMVKDFMNSDISSVDMDDSLMAVASIAIAYRRARIPVVDADNNPVGIISRRGLKHIIAQYLGIEDKETA